MPAITVLIKPASESCNMQCDYCFYCDEATKRNIASYGLMNEKTTKNVVRKFLLAATGSCTFAFQGGEPTLWGLDNFKKFIEYVKQYNKNHIPVYFSLQTNGYAITEEWCEFFHEHHFLVGVSIDGIAETHNHFRHSKTHRESYSNVLRTTQLFDKYKVEYNILTVVHKETAKEIKRIYKFYKKRNWNFQQYIACLDPLDKEHGLESYSLTPTDYSYFLNTLFDLWYQDIQTHSQPYIRQFENYISILLGYLPESCEQSGICGIQHVIEADGSVYPCDFYALDNFYLGNINEIRFADIQTKRESLGFIERSKNHSKECLSCTWHHLCRGGCYRNRENEDLNYFCPAYKAFFEQNYDKLVKIANLIKEKKKL